MATKPTQLPEWATSAGGNLIDPPQSQKDSGWSLNQVPPSAFENWRSNLVYDWLFWVDERFADGVDDDEIQINDPEGTLAYLARFSNQEISLLGDTGFQFFFDGVNPAIGFEGTNGRISFDRSTNRFELSPTGTAPIEIASNAFILPPNGAINFDGQANIVESANALTINFSLTDGASISYDGLGDDIEYDSPSNHEFLVGGVQAFAINASSILTPSTFGLGTSGGSRISLTATPSYTFTFDNVTRATLSESEFNVASLDVIAAGLTLTPSGTAPTTLGELAIDSTSEKLVGTDGSNPVSYVGQVASGTLAAVTGSQTIVTLPASSLRAGSVVKVKARGRTQSSATFTLGVEFGGVSVAGSNPGTVGTIDWSMEAEIVVTDGSISGDYHAGGSTFIAGNNFLDFTDSGSFNGAAAQAIELVFGGANTTDVLYTVEVT